MNKQLDALLLAVTLGFGGLAAMRWSQAVPLPMPAAEESALVAEAPRPYDVDSLDVAFEKAVGEDPFRLSRTPAEVPYSPEAAHAPMVPAPRFVPALVLRGIVGGPPWQAVIDGIPGSPPGMVVRTGSVFDKLTIKSVSRDSVAVQTPDSAWHLTLSRGTP